MKVNYLSLEYLKRILLVTLGSTIVSAAVYWFHIPYNLTIGGTSGMAIALSKFIPGLSVGLFLLLANVVLFFLAFLLIGFEFGGLSIYSTLVLSLSLMLFEHIDPNVKPVVDTPFMSMIIGVGLAAVGIAITLNVNASTGGTDIVGKILNKYLHINISLGVFIADFCVVLLGYFAFDINAAMYGLVGVIFNAVVIDKVLTGYRNRIMVQINSNKWQEINNFIIKQLFRGCTIYEVKGGYNKAERFVLETILERQEYIRLIEFVRNFDPQAFVTVSIVSEVLGEGFTYNNVLPNRKALAKKAKNEVANSNNKS